MEVNGCLQHLGFAADSHNDLKGLTFVNDTYIQIFLTSGVITYSSCLDVFLLIIQTELYKMTFMILRVVSLSFPACN